MPDLNKIKDFVFSLDNKERSSVKLNVTNKVTKRRKYEKR
jgi:hypothetical protein